MLKKIVRDILIVAGILLLVASTSGNIMAWISNKRNEHKSWWGAHTSASGDLVSMSYLDDVPQFSSKADHIYTPAPQDSGVVDLYLWGDSYTMDVPGDVFAGVNKYTYTRRGREKLLYDLDSKHKSVLLLEYTERTVRKSLAKTYIYDEVYKRTSPESPQNEPISLRKYLKGGNELIGRFFNPYINQNLEYNLFNYNLINPARQWKATMNYQVFSRASGDVVISADEQQLFFKETVKGKVPENAYYPVSDEEINNIVSVLNDIAAHYKAEGFYEVYLSIIPNPVSILQPEGTNQLVSRLEGHPDLKMKTISVNDIYKKTTKKIYRPGDSHWSNDGFQLWLAEMNKMLLSENPSFTNFQQ